MQKIELNELPKYTPWVARLLNVAPFQKPERNLAKIDAEYDKDKYARLRRVYEQNPHIDIEELNRIARGNLPQEQKTCVSRREELFLMSVAEAQGLDKQTVIDSLQPYMAKSRVVIELGCGYGYNLGVLREAAPDHLFIGVDYSQNAVSLALKLFRDCPEIAVSPFNFYDEAWPVFDAVEERALVFTRHAIEQLPSVKSIMPTFAKYRQKIACVIHLEPVFELNDASSTLDLMRQGYTLANDYNRDLFSCIKEMGVKILKVEKDVFSYDPLNPTSLIVWQF
jgi:SAM-dependent methyltransferase